MVAPPPANQEQKHVWFSSFSSSPEATSTESEELQDLDEYDALIMPRRRGIQVDGLLCAANRLARSRDNIRNTARESKESICLNGFICPFWYIQSDIPCLETSSRFWRPTRVI